MAKIHPPGTPRVPSRGRRAAALMKPEGGDDTTPLTEEVEDHLSPEAEEDPTVALKAQIEALTKSNREYQEKVEAERVAKTEALRRAQERDAEFGKLQEQTMNSQQEAIEAALAAANTEAEAAQRDIEQALAIADGKALGEAQRKMSRAEARILALENGKEALEREIKERPKAPEPKPVEVDPLENYNIPTLAKQWLRSHPEYLTDARKNSKLQALHWDVVDEGFAPYSQEYYDRMEQRLGMRPEPVIEEEDMDEPPEPPVKKPRLSAPPSREVPQTGTGRVPRQVTLSRAEKEAARISGISEESYAEQKLKLLQEKANGNYGGAP